MQNILLVVVVRYVVIIMPQIDCSSPPENEMHKHEASDEQLASCL